MLKDAGPEDWGRRLNPRLGVNPTIYGRKKKMSDLGEFESHHNLARFLDPIIREALNNLSDRNHDFLVRFYRFPTLELRSERSDVLYPNARQTALFRAHKALSLELQRLLRKLASDRPHDTRLQEAIAVVEGKVSFAELETDWPAPTSVETLSLDALERRHISLAPSHEAVSYFSSHPEMLHLVEPREFEMLTADLLSSFGYSVKLGPLGRDGGVDVYAERHDRLGTELILVQCKLLRSGRKVGAPVIKQLYTEVVDRNATRGIVVTNAVFTSCALDYITSHRYQLDGIDGHRLAEWLAELWRPEHL